MAIKLMKVGNSFNVPQKTYIANTVEERDELKAYFGDLCLVIEDGITYILNSEGDWYPYSTGGGGGGDANTELIAPTYTETETSYNKDQLVIYDGDLYRAKQDIDAPAGSFDTTKWDKVDVASAKADLIDGKVPASQLPSYVDDVVEYATRSQFPVEGESGKIYVAIDTGYTYRWSGTEYIVIGTIYNEVHIGPETPTGEETIWVKPEGRNQSADTLDTKEVGDWVYLEETMDGITRFVRFLIISKNLETGKAVLVREGVVSPGYRVDPPDLLAIYEDQFVDDIKACYKAANEDWEFYKLKYTGIISPLEPGETADVLPNEITYTQMYNSMQDSDFVACRFGQKVATILQFGIGSGGRGVYVGTDPYQADVDIDYNDWTDLEFIPGGFTACYIAVAFEVPLDTLLVGFDASVNKYENYILKLKQNGQWNDLDDLKIATLAEVFALRNRISELESRVQIVQSENPPEDLNVLWLHVTEDE